MAFPTTESDTMALLTRMLDGYLWYAADFPKVNRTTLYTKRTIYVGARKNHKQTQAALRIAAKATEKKMSELVKVMKICLQKSEIDTTGNPEKLKEIGWGPKESPQPAKLPGQPTNFQLTAKNNQVIKVKWERPDDNQQIRNYCIERRQQTKDGFANWTIVQISYSTEATIRSQPLGIQLEYRVRAANTAGTGPFSNTVSVIL